MFRERGGNQTKVNELKFPGNLFFFPTSTNHSHFLFPFSFNFWPPSIGLSLIFTIVNECSHSFFFQQAPIKKTKKNIARIQPSFLQFFLFWSRQHNTSFFTEIIPSAATSLFTHSNNPWWWPMKGPKDLGSILVNLSNNSNLKTKSLIRKLERSL